MVEGGKNRYELYAISNTGKRINITDAAEGLSWEEGEDELAMKITFTLVNTKMDNQLLSDYIKINCPVIVKSNWGLGLKQVADGTIVEAERNTSSNKEAFKIAAYDSLYNLQKSQDCVYIKKGKNTKNVISSILKPWNVSISLYKGPTGVKHDKICEKSKRLGDILRGVLQEAKDKGGGKAICRNVNGKFQVVMVGSNEDVYVFTPENSIQSDYKISTADMVTRVKVLCSEKNSETKPKVRVTVDGKTEYGIRQVIKTSNKSDSKKDAKKDAQEVLKEKGDPKETMRLTAPDVPPIRKGDMVRIRAGALNKDYIVKSIQHNADKGTMTMQVENK